MRADSKATLQPLGLLGDKVLDISSGTSNFNVLRPGDTLRVGTSLDYEQVLAEASFAIHDLVELTHDLKAITGGIVRGDGTMGQLVTNRSLYDELTSTLSHTNTLLSRLENKHGSIGQFIDDPTLYQNLVGMVGAVDSLAATLNSSNGTFGRFLHDDSLYNRLTGVTTGADSILHELNAGQRAGRADAQRSEDLRSACHRRDKPQRDPRRREAEPEAIHAGTHQGLLTLGAL